MLNQKNSKPMSDGDVPTEQERKEIKDMLNELFGKEEPTDAPTSLSEFLDMLLGGPSMPPISDDIGSPEHNGEVKSEDGRTIQVTKNCASNLQEAMFGHAILSIEETPSEDGERIEQRVQVEGAAPRVAELLSKLAGHLLNIGVPMDLLKFALSQAPRAAAEEKRRLYRQTNKK